MRINALRQPTKIKLATQFFFFLRKIVWKYSYSVTCVCLLGIIRLLLNVIQNKVEFAVTRRGIYIYYKQEMKTRVEWTMCSDGRWKVWEVWAGTKPPYAIVYCSRVIWFDEFALNIPIYALFREWWSLELFLNMRKRVRVHTLLDKIMRTSWREQ